MSRRKWVKASEEELAEGSKLSREEKKKLGEEDIVVLLSGFNNFGDKIYNYIKMKFKDYDALRGAIKGGGRFDIHEFGEVIAAGKGMPTPEVKAEMAAQYKMIAFPTMDE